VAGDPGSDAGNDAGNDAGDLLGIVPVVGRGDLVQHRLGSQTLVERALDFLTRLTPEVVVVSDAADALALRRRLSDSGSELSRAVIHDPLCPLVPEPFARRLLVEHDARAGQPTVAVRPVADTIKAAPGGVVAQTLDRDTLRVVGSPIVVSTRDLLSADDLAGVLADPTRLVAHLRAVSTPHLVMAPAAARRIEDLSGLRLTAAIEAAAHRSHPVSG
jgi:2-C-methyl-D-erythritol 4-phosphate cytidylyltransferase